jgi:transposase InsO family protein
MFIPCSTTITGPDVTQLYLDNIYRWFGLLRKIISDQDPRFTSHFGQALTAKLGVQQNLSTAFHPQTDGLAKRTNQWIKQYLQLITSAQPNDWSKWLTIASVVHNDRLNSTLKMSPNQALLGYRPILYPNQIIGTNNVEVEGCTDEMLRHRVQAMAAINKAVHQEKLPKMCFRLGIRYGSRPAT